MGRKLRLRSPFALQSQFPAAKPEALLGQLSAWGFLTTHFPLDFSALLFIRTLGRAGCPQDPTPPGPTYPHAQARAPCTLDGALSFGAGLPNSPGYYQRCHGSTDSGNMKDLPSPLIDLLLLRFRLPGRSRRTHSSPTEICDKCPGQAGEPVLPRPPLAQGGTGRSVSERNGLSAASTKCTLGV